MNPQSGSDNDELNTLGYASSAPDFSGLTPATDTKPQDEADYPALVMVSRVIASKKALYGSTQSLTLGELTLENQLIINKQMEFHIQELEDIINTTVKRVKEKLHGQQ